MESRSPLCKTALIIFCLVAYELVAQAQGPDLSPLSSDDRLSVELACVIDKGNGPAPYHACLQRQLGAMSGSRSPDLSALSSDDRLSVELACVIDKGNGPAPYHACLQRQLGTMSGSRSLDLSGLNATTTVPSPITSGTRLCAENGSCYGDLNANGVPKTVHVNGYYRKDGTYVRGHYRSAPGTNPSKSK
jgi:hypothetical protein